MRSLACALALATACGCVQFVNVHESPRSSPRVHQDTARVSSSTQSLDAAAEIPVSLVPK